MLREQLIITNTRPEHLRTIEKISAPKSDNGCFRAENFRHHLHRFPEGQFVALLDGKPAAYATTMRTNYSPYDPPLAWMDAIGDMSLERHNPDGQWLYGVDFCVHPDYRRCGIGTTMYQARFDLVKRLNLNGFYVGGMLAGYYRYADTMSVREYADQVISGKIDDSTVSMQIHRGFQPRALIENYVEDAPEFTSAMLLVWPNPEYIPVLA